MTSTSSAGRSFFDKKVRDEERAKKEQAEIEEAHFRKQQTLGLWKSKESRSQEEIRQTIIEGRNLLNKYSDDAFSLIDEEHDLYSFQPTEDSCVEEFNRIMSAESKKFEIVLNQVYDYDYFDDIDMSLLWDESRNEDLAQALEEHQVEDINTMNFDKPDFSYNKKGKRKAQQGSFIINETVETPSNDVAEQVSTTEKNTLPDSISKLIPNGRIRNLVFTGSQHSSTINSKMKFSMKWFEELDQDRYDYLKFKHDLDKYNSDDNFNYRYSKKAFLNIAFTPSGGGKSTTEKLFGKFVCDIDTLREFESDDEKFYFLINFSKKYEKWNVINNYWKEIIYKYYDLINGRILMCHGPDQIPKRLLNISQCVILFPKIKNFGLRSFTDNFNYLKGLKTYEKYEMKQDYYFYFMFNYFKQLKVA